MVDLHIKNALIYDGSGNEAFYGNVSVSNGKIVDVSNETFLAEKTVDAEGLAIAPGFIDVHSHSDQSIIRAPHRDHVLKMGVTTEIAGQCGISLSPDSEKIPSHARPNIYRYTPQVFSNLGEAIDKISTFELGTNQRYFTGHGLLRYATVGTEARLSSEAELKYMQDVLASEMKHGSAGFSTGLSYVPGIYSDLHELAMLAKIAGEHGGMYTTHSRSESMRLFDSVQEGFRYTRAAGEIYARTVEEFYIEIPYEYEKKEYTGVEYCDKYLIFFDYSMNISKKSGNDTSLYDKINIVENCSLFGAIPTPFSLRSEKYLEYETVYETRSPSAAEELAYYELGCRLSEISNSATLIKKTVTPYARDDRFILHCRLVLIENIAQTKEFEVDLDG